MKTTRKIRPAFNFMCGILLGSVSIICLADKPNSVALTKSSVNQGQEIFLKRCVLCHGKSAEGNGRMAKVIKSPPPFDLTSSRQPDEYLKEIIMKGSEAMGRSKHMPPWGEALNEVEIDSVILYIKSIRD